MPPFAGCRWSAAPRSNDVGVSFGGDRMPSPRGPRRHPRGCVVVTLGRGWGSTRNRPNGRRGEESWRVAGGDGVTAWGPARRAAWGCRLVPARRSRLDGKRANAGNSGLCPAPATGNSVATPFLHRSQWPPLIPGGSIPTCYPHDPVPAFSPSFLVGRTIGECIRLCWRVAPGFPWRPALEPLCGWRPDTHIPGVVPKGFYNDLQPVIREHRPTLTATTGQEVTHARPR